MLQTVRTVGLLLAAGSGSRFDPEAPGRKLLELVDGKPLVEHALDALSAAVDAVVVVTRDEFTQVRAFACARGTRVVVASDAALGMGHSLAAGVRLVMTDFPAASTVVIALADMPWVRCDTVVALVSHSIEHDRIAQPRHRGERGNPVAFPARFIAPLASSSGDAGARQLLREQGANVLLLDVDDPGVLRDVDRREDLAPGG